jgi:hypothetical protein
LVESEGFAVLKAIVDDKLQSISVSLDERMYAIASRANLSRSEVIVTGDLTRAGQRWQMTNPRLEEVPPDDP